MGVKRRVCRLSLQDTDSMGEYSREQPTFATLRPYQAIVACLLHSAAVHFLCTSLDMSFVSCWQVYPVSCLCCDSISLS
jgi:hypothetical protein